MSLCIKFTYVKLLCTYGFSRVLGNSNSNNNNLFSIVLGFFSDTLYIDYFFLIFMSVTKIREYPNMVGLFPLGIVNVLNEMFVCNKLHNTLVHNTVATQYL